MLMEKTRRRFEEEKKICRPALAVLYLLILIITAAVLLTACGHDKENESVWPHSHSTQQTRDTDKGDIKPGKRSEKERRLCSRRKHQEDWNTDMAGAVIRFPARMQINET